jgi:hypothetical protein
MPRLCSLVEVKSLQKSSIRAVRTRMRTLCSLVSATEEQAETGMVKTKTAMEARRTIHLLRMDMAEGELTQRAQEEG